MSTLPLRSTIKNHTITTTVIYYCCTLIFYTSLIILSPYVPPQLQAVKTWLNTSRVSILRYVRGMLFCFSSSSGWGKMKFKAHHTSKYLHM